MFKKNILFYTSLIITMSFVLMVLLITKTLIDIAKYKNTQINNFALSESSNLYKNNLKISTNKNIYTSKEDVIITFENLGKKKITQRDNSSLTIKCRPDIGNNYELAFIEHKEEGKWIAIEPVNRCSKDCSEFCSSNKEIDAQAKTSFVWPQTVLQCAGERDSEVSQAPFGEYRISSATLGQDKTSFVRIYSDIFKISSISKK